MGGFPNIMNIYSKPSCDIIIICFPDKTIFILLDCFMQLLQIQMLAKYDHCVNDDRLNDGQNGFIIHYGLNNGPIFLSKKNLAKFRCVNAPLPFL